MKLKPLLACFTALVLAFMYAPLAVLIAQSFNTSKYIGVWKGFTLEWYFRLTGDYEVLEATFNGLAVATLSALISTLLGGIAGYYFSRYSRSGVADSLLYVPIVIPEIVEAVSLLMLYVALNVELGFWTVLIGHIAYNISYSYLAIKPQFEMTPHSLEEAAINLGATPIEAFLKVLLPLATPGIISSVLITFSMSFDDFVKTLFTTGPGFKTLPLVIWIRAARARATPELNALASIMVAISLLSSYIYTRYLLEAKKEK
ncbi:MAG TPA: ABC transporter permease [Thermofilum sp.]|nr:ABC transporter permease [Thermofilum sp.]